ncbi:MAG: NAD(P)H-hydrate dehydratase [Bacillota bacterium]
MKIVTGTKMAEIDGEAMSRFAIPGLILMENAGLQVVRYLEKIWTGQGRGRLLIFCGKGNNGGDGFVIARHLAQRGYHPVVWAMDRCSGYRGDAAVNYEILLKQGFPVHLVTEGDPGEILKELGEDDLIVDALLGTGLKREVSAPFAALIGAINESRAPVLSVDIPSGVCADSGEIMGIAVKAQHTVTFALPKRGLLLYPGAACAGGVVVADIGIPAQLSADPAVRENLITGSTVRFRLPARLPQSHKGTYGRLLLLAGAPGMSGAAVLAAEAALRGGAGLVYLGAAPELRPVMEAKLKEVIVRELPGDGAGNLDACAFPRIREEARSCRALAMGPGMDPGPATLALLQQIMEELPFPLVVDAGALAALARKTSLLQGKKPPLVLTPHPGEMANLLGADTEAVQRERWALAAGKAREWGCVLVLKGAYTAVGLPTGELFINPTGNAALATAGSGDLLTGLIAALLTQGVSPEDAAVAGVYLHGLAADLLVAARGIRGHTAGDILPFFPAAFRQVENLEPPRPGEFVPLT